ncbi:hypothetical protein K440DRAFT_317980 [Wilcoxina mikolae CBS 423.85]|nr:hypothetical protein K440DRAFT_317980 [Wilcoxina mikolae CBS 423.85]
MVYLVIVVYFQVGDWIYGLVGGFRFLYLGGGPVAQPAPRVAVSNSWQIVVANIKVTSNPSCGMHIHVSLHNARECYHLSFS